MEKQKQQIKEKLNRVYDIIFIKLILFQLTLSTGIFYYFNKQFSILVIEFYICYVLVLLGFKFAAFVLLVVIVHTGYIIIQCCLHCAPQAVVNINKLEGPTKKDQ